MIPIISSLLEIGAKVLDRVIPDVAAREKAKAEFQLQVLQQETELVKTFAELDKSQIEVNKEEAKSSSLFVSGWRPFIGWVCGSAFAWVYIGQPVLIFFLTAAGHPIALPHIEFGEISGVLLGMLGLGGMRSYEKVKGVANK